MTLHPRLLESVASEHRIEAENRYRRCVDARRHAPSTGRARLGWLLIETGWRLVAPPRQRAAEPAWPAAGGQRIVR